MGTPNEISFIWPIENPDSVNFYRTKAGFGNTVEENAKNLFGEDFEFKNYSIEEIESLKNGIDQYKQSISDERQKNL